jgi:hypothetical protein
MKSSRGDFKSREGKGKGGESVCVCVYVCSRARVCACYKQRMSLCMCVCARACLRACLSVCLRVSVSVARPQASASVCKPSLSLPDHSELISTTTLKHFKHHFRPTVTFVTHKVRFFTLRSFTSERESHDPLYVPSGVYNLTHLMRLRVDIIKNRLLQKEGSKGVS